MKADYDKLIEQNRAWVKKKGELNPEFFLDLEKEQHPKFLYIGCSDSRVPASNITGTEPGEIFVHRNIANMVVHTDLNMLSVLQYAVEVLEVEHVIVCGHYGCGGVKSAMSNKNFGLINKWLRNIKEVYRLNQQELDAMNSEQDRFDRMVELNVLEQCSDLTKTSIIQHAWHERKMPYVHGWVYSLHDGTIKELCTIEPNIESVDPLFRFEEAEEGQR